MNAAGIHLKTDGIKEALFEIRFDTPVVPEAVIGRLTDAAVWKDFTPARMPSADIPQQLRQVDPNLRFQPSYELRRGAPTELIRIGPSSLSYHQLAPYPGWAAFSPTLEQVVHTLFEKLVDLRPLRLGFRYVNALTGADHGIATAADLALKMVVGDSDKFVPQIFALNYRQQNHASHVEQIQVATPDYVQGDREFSVMVDIDIFTPDNYVVADASDVLSWIRMSHDLLKENFFKLLPNDTIERLRVK